MESGYIAKKVGKGGGIFKCRFMGLGKRVSRVEKDGERRKVEGREIRDMKEVNAI